MLLKQRDKKKRKLSVFSHEQYWTFSHLLANMFNIHTVAWVVFLFVLFFDSSMQESTEYNGNPEQERLIYPRGSGTQLGEMML